ncbi:hypothetical protein F5Y08DRAFT_312486 [Xylaria arbuscula]|nr:hypothetical protein F5Y08DRAFT_312486 [Xylaria arbuscula]
MGIVAIVKASALLAFSFEHTPGSCSMSSLEIFDVSLSFPCFPGNPIWLCAPCSHHVFTHLLAMPIIYTDC